MPSTPKETVSADQAANAGLNGVAPMPPVTTQTSRSDVTAGDAPMAAPFQGQPTIETRASFEAPAPLAAEEDDLQWGDDLEEEGTVEAVFEADVSATSDSLKALSRAAQAASAPAGDDAFPMDAFIIPEHSRRLPEGLSEDTVATPQAQTPVTDLADRLEKLSHRLRVEETEAIVTRLTTGDKLDALIAGLISGYLAGK